MIEAGQWDHLGAFAYSHEEDTAAWQMKDDVPAEVKERRLREIMELQQGISTSLLEKRIGTVQEVLVEGRDPLSGMYIGRSVLFAPDNVDGCVRFRSESGPEKGDFVKVRYTRTAGHNLIGEETE